MQDPATIILNTFNNYFANLPYTLTKNIPFKTALEKLLLFRIDNQNSLWVPYSHYAA